MSSIVPATNLYMYCSLIIDTAEKEYVLDDVYIWIIGGQCGVCLDQRLQTGTISDEIKGKTAQQMFDMLRDTASEE